VQRYAPCGTVMRRYRANTVPLDRSPAEAHFCAVGKVCERRPRTARREALWLEAVEKLGWTVAQLVQATGLGKRRIQQGLKRARNEPIEESPQTVFDIEWISTANAFTIANQCHWHQNQPIPEGIAKGCLYCLDSGLRILMARHGEPVGTSTAQPDTTLSGAEIATAVQPHGPAKFTPHASTRRNKSFSP
jgi:hypothetical protein